MARRTLLSKAHLLRSNGFFTSNTQSLTYLLLPNSSKLRPTLLAPPHSAAVSGDFRRPHRRFCTGATTQSNQSASVESPLMQSMEKKIKEQLNAETVTVKDAYGDGRHVTVYVISTAFEGQNTVNRQRMVYKAIWEELQDTVHAVHQMITITPAEAKSKSQ